MTLPKPSNSQIDKAGKTLLEDVFNQEAFDTIHHWRSLHIVPLVELSRLINQYILPTSNIVYRLKRIPTIVNKISRMGTINNIGQNATEIHEYSADQLALASEAYATNEREFINDDCKMVLLVSASGFQKLKEGYLAYFLDAKYFIKKIKKILDF